MKHQSQLEIYHMEDVAVILRCLDGGDSDEVGALLKKHRHVLAAIRSIEEHIGREWRHADEKTHARIDIISGYVDFLVSAYDRKPSMLLIVILERLCFVSDPTCRQFALGAVRALLRNHRTPPHHATESKRIEQAKNTDEEVRIPQRASS